ncbi:MAG: hypothetical protein GC129_02790 [Proteobacteria bacterium]|nr:hypothetical protein [Pseudomonadota bacterium]
MSANPEKSVVSLNDQSAQVAAVLAKSSQLKVSSVIMAIAEKYRIKAMKDNNTPNGLVFYFNALLNTEGSQQSDNMTALAILTVSHDAGCSLYAGHIEVSECLRNDDIAQLPPIGCSYAVDSEESRNILDAALVNLLGLTLKYRITSLAPGQSSQMPRLYHEAAVELKLRLDKIGGKPVLVQAIERVRLLDAS